MRYQNHRGEESKQVLVAKSRFWGENQNLPKDMKGHEVPVGIRT